MTQRKAYANLERAMMKQKSTTLVSLSRRTKKAFIFFTAFVLIAAGVGYVQRPASADQYDDKIAALQADMARYQAQADALNAQANTLANAVAQLTNQKNALQAQIDVSQAQYNQLVIQIADTEKQIKDNQDALGKTIADLYVDDSISPVEMLASSNNISDYLNKQEYRNSVKDQLSSTIKKVKDLKVQLSAQRDDLSKVLAEQKSSRDELASREAEQANLLTQTQNNEANYQNMIKDSQAQIAEARATQAALSRRFSSSGGYVLVDSGSLGDYPWNSSNCPMLGYLSTGGYPGTDGEDGHGYGCRQCASYVAWRIAKETGIYPSWGDAVNFTNAAINTFHSADGAPQAGSIAVMDSAKAGQSHGHVAWVEAVSGGKVLVSQYNYDYGAGFGMYSEMWLSSGAFDHYVKIK